MELERIAVRAIFAFVTLQALLRTSGKREIGESTPFDFVLALILGDMVDDLLWAEVAASDFVAATGAASVMHVLVSWICSRSVAVSHLVNGRPTQLMSYGHVVPAGLRRERLSEEDLASMFRSHGLPDDTRVDVREARLEISGGLTVTRRERARPAMKSDLPPRGRG